MTPAVASIFQPGEFHAFEGGGQQFLYLVPSGGIFAGLVVRNQKIDALIAAILSNFAEDLVHLVVLVGSHIEERIALLAGVAGGARIRTYQDRFGVRHGLVDRLQYI